MAQRSIDPDSRFWSKVRKAAADGCWEWTGAVTQRGYGRFWPTHRTMVRAHRYAYQRLVGPIPEGLTIDHLCRNPSCVNPAHLEPVSNRTNILRSDGLSAKGARQTHCKRGHPFDIANTHIYVGVWGHEWRRCRTCDRLRSNLRHPPG